ncbi:hypothetical protein BD779DRAFT_159330 [Infundibulicybe gibba]|nr:hypothetical protein BD779DRAFT_159330 [Infundibulicybe gibba]
MFFLALVPVTSSSSHRFLGASPAHIRIARPFKLTSSIICESAAVLELGEILQQASLMASHRRVTKPQMGSFVVYIHRMGSTCSNSKGYHQRIFATS